MYSVTPFVPAKAAKELDECSFVEIHVVDYAIFKVLQVKSFAPIPLLINDIIVNGEFRALSIASLGNWLVSLRLPKTLRQGAAFHAILPDTGHSKTPESLIVATDGGEFCFMAGKMVKFVGAG